MAARRTGAGLIGPLAIGIVGVAILVGLGFWQVQRLHWKEGVIADRAARIAAAPVALPAAPDPTGDRFLPVAVEGRFTGPALRVLASRKQQGPGHRIVAAFETTGGRRILIDRGFLPEGTPPAPPPEGVLRIAGNLHWPAEADRFTPPPEGDLWFARDVAAMAAALGTEPVLLVAATATGGAIAPMPVDTADIPNDHLGYAVQWFGLACVWAGMTILWIRRIARRTA